MKAKRILVAIAIVWFVAFAAFYAFDSIRTVFRFGAHALYADQWREYLDYVTRPFPENVFHPDNGHRSVLPNFIAWLEILWFGGNQWLQIVMGIACGLAASAIAATLCMRDRDVPLVYRGAALFLCFFAIFWLANVRTLFHSTELLHTKLPMLCLIAAIALSIHAAKQTRVSFALICAILLALAATFSFGYGVSVFLGVFATLIACKADWRVIAVSAGGFGVAVVLYLTLPGSEGVRGSLTFAPFENLLAGARWLGAPFTTMFAFLWDPNLAGLVPKTLRYLAVSFATAAAPRLPDMHSSVLPQALFGGLGMIALLVASFRRFRANTAAGSMEAVGLGISWLGLGAAGIVSLSRLTYFQQYPEQIYADRYLCWPCLFWLGLALIGLSSGSRRRVELGSARKQKGPVAAMAVLACAALIPLFAWPTQVAGTIYAALVRGHIDNMGAGTVVGVFERGAETGESDPAEVVRGIPAMSARHIAQFGEPAAQLIGQPLPAGMAPIEGATIETQPINDNLFGDSGTRVTLRLPETPTPAPRFLLVDSTGRVVGLVVRDARVQPPGYSGYARGVLTSTDLRAARAP